MIEYIYVETFNINAQEEEEEEKKRGHDKSKIKKIYTKSKGFCFVKMGNLNSR